MDGIRLERLDIATCSKLRSTQIITSLPQIVSELVQNSLDAGASAIEIGVNKDEWSCWVRDNGTGISKDGLSQLATSEGGGRYSSSKAYDSGSLDYVDTFGFRGEALASISDLACIEITARTKFSKESRTIVLRNGQCLYDGPSVRSRRESAGTDILVREAFFNIPVRRTSHPNAARTVERIRRDVEILALAHNDVHFRLSDESKLLYDGRDRSLTLAIPKTASSYLTFKHIYGRALVEHVEHINVKQGSITIEGFLSLIGSHSNAHQFLYLNRHILSYCELHHVIEGKFASSSFTKHALDENGELPDDEYIAKRRSPRKGIRKAIYVLKLDIPASRVDNLLEPAKSSVHLEDESCVVSFLADVVEGFLIKHGFKKRSTPIALRSQTAAAKKRPNNFDFDNEDYVSRHKKIKIKSKPQSISQEVVISDECFEELTWRDPITQKVYHIDPRSGNSYAREDVPAIVQSPGSQSPPRRTLNPARMGCNHTDTPEWIRKALCANDAFQNAEAAVRSVPSPAPLQRRDAENGKHERRAPWKRQFNKMLSTMPACMHAANDLSTSSFSKRSLEEATVLGQVDSKFIACLLGLENEANEGEVACRGARALVLLDQHAADERIRVERLLKALCLAYLDRHVGEGVERCVLERPAGVLLSRFEHDCLTKNNDMRLAFADWGLELIDTEPASKHIDIEDAYATVYFRTIPKVVSEKLLANSGADLRELVKGFLARLENESILQNKKKTRDAADDNTAWLSALRHCPRELTDLVNSRACRGAIMFNDRLSEEQCRRLVRQLSQAAFPFQCAHGRPSTVPLSVIKEESMVDHLIRPVNWEALICTV